MAVALTGTAGLFTRIGLIGGILSSVNTYRGTTLPAKVVTLDAQFDADPDFIAQLYPSLTAWQGGAGSLSAYLKGLARTVVIEMVNDDNEQPDKGIETALIELVRQMTGSSDSVNASSSVGLTSVAYASNTGVGVTVCSAKLRSGRYAENAIVEDIILKCNADAQNDGLTSGNETFAWQGEFATGDSLSWLWPQGSGGSGSLTVISAADDAKSSGNLTTNGDFETFTVANTPDNWTVATGVVGTSVKQGAVPYLGSANLEIVGDGAELTCLRQTFNSSSGSLAVLEARQQYAFNAWMRVSASATGVLRIALVDGSNAVINDDQGTANSFTQNVAGLTTSYAQVSGTFRLPRVLPSSIKLEMKLTTALQNTKKIYIDEVCLAVMSQLYTQGPSVAVFRGSTAFITEDYFTLTTANTAGGFQRLFDRLFDMRSLSLLLPSNDAGAETVLDSLIT